MPASGLLLSFLENSIHGVSISMEDSGNHTQMGYHVEERLNLLFLSLKFRTKIGRCMSI